VSAKLVLEGTENAPKSVVKALACPVRTNNVAKTRKTDFGTAHNLDFIAFYQKKFVCQ